MLKFLRGTCNRSRVQACQNVWSSRSQECWKIHSDGWVLVRGMNGSTLVMTVSRNLCRRSHSHDSLCSRPWHGMGRKAKKQKLDPGQKTLQSYFSSSASAPAAVGSPKSPITIGEASLISAASTGTSERSLYQQCALTITGLA